MSTGIQEDRAIQYGWVHRMRIKRGSRILIGLFKIIDRILIEDIVQGRRIELGGRG